MFDDIMSRHERVCRRWISAICGKTSSPTYFLPVVLPLLEASRQWCVCDCHCSNGGYVWFSAQMQFKYAQKGEHGELFEKGVVLARQFLGEGNWEVWDLRPDCDKWCQRCSSKAERLVRHNNGPCPERTNQRALGERRSAARRKAISEAKETERIRQVPVDEEPGVEPHTSGESDHDGHVSRAGPKKTAVIPAPLPRKAPAMPPGDDDSDYEDQQRPKKSRAVASATAPQRRRTARARSPGESEYEYKPRPTKVSHGCPCDGRFCNPDSTPRGTRGRSRGTSDCSRDTNGRSRGTSDRSRGRSGTICGPDACHQRVRCHAPSVS